MNGSRISKTLLARTALSGVALALAATFLARPADAQLRPSYQHGQHVSPAFEGWVLNEDGSIDILFGYMNRNWEEVVHVPIGEHNRFINGPDEDLGQPTEFLPRRNRFTFSVPAPEGMTEDDELIWELTSHGETQRAYASIKPDFRVDNVAIMSETGALGAGTSDEELRANEPPTIELEGDLERTVRVGETVRLVATVMDDGVPEREESALRQDEEEDEEDEESTPPATPEELLERALRPQSWVTVNKHNSLYMSWFPYRGDGEVTFEPAQVKPYEDTRPFANSPWAPFWDSPDPPEDGRWVTEVTFNDPGTYVLRGRADDGGLYSDVEVTFHVEPLLP